MSSAESNSLVFSGDELQLFNQWCLFENNRKSTALELELTHGFRLGSPPAGPSFDILPKASQEYLLYTYQLWLSFKTEEDLKAQRKPDGSQRWTLEEVFAAWLVVMAEQSEMLEGFETKDFLTDPSKRFDFPAAVWVSV